MSGPPLIDTCATCLRRAFLLGVLAPRIQAVLDTRSRRPRGILALPDNELIAAVGGSAGEALRFLAEFEATRAVDDLTGAQMSAICLHSVRYPASLLHLGDPPAVLFAAGRVDAALSALAATPAVALVGTRRPSAYGLEMARSLGRGLGAAGLVVVSGLALGIDAAAHEGCLAGAGLPVAVLGGGADVPYPRTNRGLYGRVIEAGAVFAEMPPGQEPFRWGFPARNRIMAGLTEATVVVEAAPRSGSLITSECATDLGRIVAAVPGQATSTGARGGNALLRAGAPVITETRDVLDELFGAGFVVRTGSGGGGGQAAPTLDRVEAVVLDGVGKQWDLDRICAAAGVGIQQVRSVLSRLEAGERVSRDGLGGYTARAPPA